MGRIGESGRAPAQGLPQPINIFGLVISAAGLIGSTTPPLLAINYLFGIGANVWWLAIGIHMLRKQNISGSE